MLEGSEKKHSYDKFWLAHDMDNMGYLFEYCEKYCMELANVQIDRSRFLNAFMRSRLRYEMENGHPKLLSQAAKDTVSKFIEVDCNGSLADFESQEKECIRYAANQFYWVGWMYAYIHYEKDMPSAELIERLPLANMLELYHLGHEMDRAVFLEKIEEMLQ